jgi:phospholipase/carboxylesterase
MDRAAMPTPGALAARPHPAHAHATRPGIHALDSGDGLVYVPESYRAQQPAPLVVMLHGAGGNAMQAIRFLRHAADHDGLLLLAPKSHHSTWDVLVERGFGDDTREIDRELKEVFSAYAVDAERVAIAGFSDGASYALSLGLSNGELFSDILAFSPGYMRPEALRGKPRIYVTHGAADAVLNIDLCSRVLVKRLRTNGYAVEYKEFAGGHALPPEIATRAARWFLRG